MENDPAGGHLVLIVVNALLNTITILYMAWLDRRYRNGR